MPLAVNTSEVVMPTWIVTHHATISMYLYLEFGVESNSSNIVGLLIYQVNWIAVLKKTINRVCVIFFETEHKLKNSFQQG